MLPKALKLRWRRKRLLWRAFRSRRDLTLVRDRTHLLRPDTILSITTLRNEALRLPYFLRHHRALGVEHFLIVDNGSDDGSAEWLAHQPDVSLWHTDAPYRQARFGVDWMNWLLRRYGHGRWCLMLDADELLVYSGCAQHPLPDLVRWLSARGHMGFGALMLDIYPKGPITTPQYTAGQNPSEVLDWFDPGPYRAQRQMPLRNLWVQGGARERVFFADAPQRSPTLNKLPLIHWRRSYAWVNSCHSVLPARLNLAYDGPGGMTPGGVLLHSKFLPGADRRARTEKQRRMHFNHPEDFDTYYDQIAAGPDLWHAGARHYTGPDALVDAGLMPAIDWGCAN